MEIKGDYVKNDEILDKSELEKQIDEMKKNIKEVNYSR